jgi:hypothetical protein
MDVIGDSKRLKARTQRGDKPLVDSIININYQL